MEHLKNFVITLTTISVFIVAVELLLPDNKLKKYQEFVLSLIVLAVILTPIIKIFNGSNIARDIEFAIDNELNVNNENFYEGKTSSSFIIARLEDNCKIILEEEFKENKFNISVDGKVDLDNFDMKFNEIVISVKDKGKEKSKVEAVDKIVVDSHGDEIEISDQIKSIIASELQIDKDIISVVKG